MSGSSEIWEVVKNNLKILRFDLRKFCILMESTYILVENCTILSKSFAIDMEN